MRNLVLLDSVRIGDAPELEGAKYLSIDYDTKDIYSASDSSLYLVHPESQEVKLPVVYYCKNVKVIVIITIHLQYCWVTMLRIITVLLYRDKAPDGHSNLGLRTLVLINIKISN